MSKTTPRRAALAEASKRQMARLGGDKAPKAKRPKRPKPRLRKSLAERLQAQTNRLKFGAASYRRQMEALERRLGDSCGETADDALRVAMRLREEGKPR